MAEDGGWNEGEKGSSGMARNMKQSLSGTQSSFMLMISISEI